VESRSGRGVSCGSPIQTVGAFAAQSIMDLHWTATPQSCYSAAYGFGVLDHSRTNWIGSALNEKGCIEVVAQSKSVQLLAPAGAAWAITRFHEKPILRFSMLSFFSEFWRFMRVRKKYWLLPILIMMVVFGGLIVFTKGTAIAPFIYTIF
jgi:hypothetical protein